MKELIVKDLFEIIKSRQIDKVEGSYTCYLFEKGLDKILKKCGEECAELIIAAKNADNGQIVYEACDLVYHMLVLLAERGISLDAMYEELFTRAEKQRNLKIMHDSDKNT
ncbi:MAG: phosphoribosyl-ATP diphosphatase [Clostridia bacterium]|nr:phosphoribosyl-ATP diphosphatase [Clostridia bacterium]